MANVVVTGATQGIGRAIAEKFLKQGNAVAICARTASDLDSVVAEWRELYPKADIFAQPADLAHAQEVKDFARAVADRWSQVDVLVNNAGLFFPGQLATEPEGQLEHLMAVNLYSAYHLTRALLPVMKRHSGAHIFNLCSVASLRAYDAGGAYSITKYALSGFSENLRHELMAEGIKVTALMPGATWSRSWQQSGLPQERLMTANDVADMVWAAWQLSPQANVETIVMRPLEGDI